MAKFEKVGNYLLFEKTDEDQLAANYLAGQISGNQIQQICVVKKFEPSLASVPAFIQELNHEYEAIKSLSNPNIVKPNVFIHDKKEFAAVFDYVEGRSLRNVLNRCNQDGFPFSVDHSLLVASRLCTALEYLHSKKVNDQKMVHGYVSPEAILVTYDGEIRLQYLGLAHTLLKHPEVRDKFFQDYKNYLAPELTALQKWDKAIDIYSTGLVLFEMLTGETLDRSKNVQPSINNAEMFSTAGDRVPVSDDLKKLLLQALAQDPAQRFTSIADMRKALDLILFSSEFSPTTFNLAFFMHSLFREQIEEENKSIALFKKTDPTPYLKEEPAPAPVQSSPVIKPQHAAAAQPKKEPAHAPAAPAQRLERPPAAAPVSPEMFGASEEKEKSRAPLFIAILLVLAVVGALIYFFALKPTTAQQSKKPSVPVQQTPVLTPEQIQAQEAERKRLEDEALKAQEEAKKKDEELKTLQAKLDALMRAQLEEAKKQKESKEAEKKELADLAAIKKLQEEARKLEEEKKQQQLLAEQKLKEAQAPPPATGQQPVEQVASTNNPPLPAPTDGTPQQPGGQQEPAPAVEEPAAPQVIEGMIVDLTPDVVKPEIIKRVNPNYPPVAQQKKMEGTVILSVLVSERGDAIEAKVLRGAGGTSGLNEAAMDAVRKWKFRPAVKEGKRVKVWMTYPIVFKLQ